ncbi:unnamed protein product [Alternaria alternata]
MSTGSETNVVPHRLCRRCDYVVEELRPNLSTKLEPGHDRILYYYPNIQTFINNILQERCHLCAILAGWLVKSQRVNTVDEAVEKLDKYRDKAASPLFMIMKNSTISSRDGWQDFDLYLGYDKDGRSLDVVSHAALNHFKTGTGKTIVAPEVLSTSTGSNLSYANIKKWLHICSTEHPGCHGNSKRRAPTRLLDLEIGNTKSVRLVAGSTIGQAPYVALSYCWGTVPQLMLLPERCSEFQTQISFESLSKVAQDATVVCRNMSVRYLWIDALCIIQGPDGDFQQEAARMEDVYANALFTITAAACTDTTQPFLLRRNPLSWIDCQIFDNESGEYSSYIEGNTYCDRDDNVPGVFALDSRGWCFQEQFLSPRSLYFGTKGVHWECRESLVCEHLPDMTVQHFEDGPNPSRKKLYTKLASLDDLSDPATNYKLRETWGEIIQQYSETRLTHRSDKLVALAGIASIIESKFDMRSSFGLWLEMIIDELLWFRCLDKDAKVVRLDIAPTWSWISLADCIISGANTLHDGEIGEEHRLVDGDSATVVSLPSPTVFATPLWTPGARNEAPIRLKGRLTACIHRTVKSKFRDEFINRLDPKDCTSASTQMNGEYYPDTDLGGMELYCFLLRREHREFLNIQKGEDSGAHTVWNHCLVLSPIVNARSRFRRTGVYLESSRALKHHQNATNVSDPVYNSHMFPGEGKEQEIEIV